MAKPVKRCNCRDANGKLLGKQCPQLAKRDHGAWWYRYEAPPAADGKRRRPWAGPYRTKTEAEQEGSKLAASVASGAPAPDRKLKLGAFLRNWIKGKQQLSERTRKGYAEHIDLYLEPGLGHVPLAELREHHLSELYEAMAQINRPLEGEPSEMLRRLLAVRASAAWDGAKPGQLHISKPLSPARIHRVHATLSSALSSAMRQKAGGISHDPSKNIELPKVRKRRPLLWTPERVASWRAQVEAEAAKPAAKRQPVPRPGPVMVWTPALVGEWLDLLVEWDVRLYPLFHLIATRGLRRSEACNLEWIDTSLTGKGPKTISVLEDENAEAEAGIKSESSRRVVVLDDVNTGLLLGWRRRQAAERLAAGPRWVGSDKVFTDERGRPLDPDKLSDHFEWLIKKSGLPPVRLHDLRHCAATLMLAAGADMKDVSATLGHRQFWFTADTYTVVLPELAAASAQATVAMIPRRTSRVSGS
ncbi:tyrosine-type recombinase/integrase [Nonomuraea aridisoli]|uniref:Site-specific integrase n=1 Tax=Nonomuraea aridisoli TaxID=2070368 RepID=A0A2W2F668_9ACTN|nr:tyrosine-type recombinase/integrase [Nonomuraea aridisoli]PZG20578.1 site-specific integrase [Nonomuraea aridisoli]